MVLYIQHSKMLLWKINDVYEIWPIIVIEECSFFMSFAWYCRSGSESVPIQFSWFHFLGYPFPHFLSYLLMIHLCLSYMEVLPQHLCTMFLMYLCLGHWHIQMGCWHEFFHTVLLAKWVWASQKAQLLSNGLITDTMPEFFNFIQILWHLIMLMCHTWVGKIHLGSKIGSWANN